MKGRLSHRHSFPPLTDEPTLTSSTSAFRPTTPHKHVTVTSSLFPEIEQLNPSVSSIASVGPEQLVDEETIPQKTFQELAIEHIEPFISPLTESNLKYHTGSYPPAKETRQQFVQSYIRSQASVQELETEMQRQRKAEVRSLIPLDTRSINDEVIQDENETPLTVAQNGYESMVPNSPQLVKKRSRKKWYKFFTRLIGHGSKKSKAVNKPMTSPAANANAGADADSSRRARHVSWAPGMIYEQYKQSKNEMIERGMFGLSNRNIAKALGGDKAVSMIFLPPEAHEQEQQRQNQQQQPQRQQSLTQSHRSNSRKRDSGISLFAAFSSSSRQSRKRFSTLSVSNRRSINIGFSPQLGALEEEDSSNPIQRDHQEFMAFRYPRMVRRQTLRDAAIRLLSSDFSMWSDMDTGNYNPSEAVTLQSGLHDNHWKPNGFSKRFSDPGLGVRSSVNTCSYTVR